MPHFAHEPIFDTRVVTSRDAHHDHCLPLLFASTYAFILLRRRH